MADTNHTLTAPPLVKDYRHFVLGAPSVITDEAWTSRNALADRYYPHIHDLMAFEEDHLWDILWDVDQDEKPAPEFPVGSPGAPRPMAWLPRRSWLEWHLFRGIAPAARRVAIPKRIRELVIARDGYVCGICSGDVDPTDVHLDHIKPRSKGGPDTVSNLQVSHSLCNMRKGARI